MCFLIKLFFSLRYVVLQEDIRPAVDSSGNDLSDTDRNRSKLLDINTNCDTNRRIGQAEDNCLGRKSNSIANGSSSIGSSSSSNSSGSCGSSSNNSNKANSTSSFVSQFRAINAASVMSSSNVNGALPATTHGHRGLPQVVTRSSRPVALNRLKKTVDSAQHASSSSFSKNNSFCFNNSTLISENHPVNRGKLLDISNDEPRSKIPKLANGEKPDSPGPSHSTVPTNGESESTPKNTLVPPLSRSLIDYRPGRIIQGDGLHSTQLSMYSSAAILRRLCAACSAQEKLYKLQPCDHLLCYACIQQQALRDVTSGKGSDVTANNTKRSDSILCCVCKVLVERKNITRYHNRSITTR